MKKIVLVFAIVISVTTLSGLFFFAHKKSTETIQINLDKHDQWVLYGDCKTSEWEMMGVGQGTIKINKKDMTPGCEFAVHLPNTNHWLPDFTNQSTLMVDGNVTVAKHAWGINFKYAGS
ncbi:MAG: hypothetical protein WC460_00390 [Patescibacteria group bacterium]